MFSHCAACKFSSLCLPEGREKFLERWEVCDACGRFLLHVDDVFENVDGQAYPSSQTLWYWDGPPCLGDYAIPHLYTGCFTCEKEGESGLRVSIGERIGR